MLFQTLQAFRRNAFDFQEFVHGFQSAAFEFTKPNEPVGKGRANVGKREQFGFGRFVEIEFWFGERIRFLRLKRRKFAGDDAVGFRSDEGFFVEARKKRLFFYDAFERGKKQPDAHQSDERGKGERFASEQRGSRRKTIPPIHRKAIWELDEGLPEYRQTRS